MELADVTDSKSVDGDIVWVRVPPPAPRNFRTYMAWKFLFYGFSRLSAELTKQTTTRYAGACRKFSKVISTVELTLGIKSENFFNGKRIISIDFWEISVYTVPLS